MYKAAGSLQTPVVKSTLRIKLGGFSASVAGNCSGNTRKQIMSKVVIRSPGHIVGSDESV
jgi:hypothetical protein